MTGRKGKPMEETRINLQLFAEGAGGEGAAGAEGSGQAAAAGMEAKAERGSFARGRRREEPANIVYGLQDKPQVAPAGQTEAAEQTEGTEGNQAEDFESLINGRFKQDFQDRVHGIVQDRLKTTRERESQVNPILELLADRYGMDAGDLGKLDLNALREKILSDTSQYEQEAADKGLPVEVVADLHKLQHIENTKAREQQRQEMQQRFMAQQQQIQDHYRGLQRQAEEVKKLYPGFNLDEELKNKTFLEMTRPGSGVDVLAAYRAVHHDQLAGAEMKFAAEKAAQRVSASVAANGRRPAENGLRGSTATINKTDPSTFTPEDFKRINKEVRGGAKIRF